MPELRDGRTVEDVRLDRIPSVPDERDRLYSIMDLVGGQERPVSVQWDLPPDTHILDQGQEGACVGMGCTHELLCQPVPVLGLDETFARSKVYWPAQRIDPWPGGAYPGATPQYEGTSLRAGLKILTALGYVGEYRWAATEQEMALGISAGPIIIAVDWYQGMYKPSRDGYLRPTGKKVGGHCVLVTGLKITNSAGMGYYTVLNSWGSGWGINGTARISRASMTRLKDQGGEAAIITQRYNPPQPR